MSKTQEAPTRARRGFEIRFQALRLFAVADFGPHAALLPTNLAPPRASPATCHIPLPAIRYVKFEERYLRPLAVNRQPRGGESVDCVPIRPDVPTSTVVRTKTGSEMVKFTKSDGGKCRSIPAGTLDGPAILSYLN
jgi:hypothetical protein